MATTSLPLSNATPPTARSLSSCVGDDEQQEESGGAGGEESDPPPSSSSSSSSSSPPVSLGAGRGGGSSIGCPTTASPSVAAAASLASAGGCPGEGGSKKYSGTNVGLKADGAGNVTLIAAQGRRTRGDERTGQRRSCNGSGAQRPTQAGVQRDTKQSANAHAKTSWI
jgi:hypothetical protein